MANGTAPDQPCLKWLSVVADSTVHLGGWRCWNETWRSCNGTPDVCGVRPDVESYWRPEELGWRSPDWLRVVAGGLRGRIYFIGARLETLLTENPA